MVANHRLGVEAKETIMGKRSQIACICVGAIAIVVLVSGPARASDGDRFQGSWRVIYAEVGNKEATDAQLKLMEVTIDGDKFTLVNGAKRDVVHFNLDPTTRPHAIEFFRTSDKAEKVWHGIYAFDDRKLKLCWGPAGNERPVRFSASTSNKHSFIIIQKK
jgi:uncharacterized protein (TIGR03067 family)